MILSMIVLQAAFFISKEGTTVFNWKTMTTYQLRYMQTV